MVIWPVEIALERTGSVITGLRGKQRWQLEQAWREIYAHATHSRTGKWRVHDHDWETFAGDDTPRESGHRAIELFVAEAPRVFLVWPEESSLPMWKCEGGSHRPLVSLCSDDVIVFPPDLSWTMAFTHEQQGGFELGPYFSRSAWQQQR